MEHSEMILGITSANRYLYNEAGIALKGDSEDHVSYTYLHSDTGRALREVILRIVPATYMYLYNEAGTALTRDSEDHVSNRYLYNEAGIALKGDSDDHVSYIYLYNEQV